MKTAKRIISIPTALMIFAVGMSACESDKSDDVTQLKLSDFSKTDGLPGDIKADSWEIEDYPLDEEYLKEIGTPQDVISDVSSPTISLTVNSEDYICSFECSDIMTQLGTNIFKIYAYNKETDTDVCVYESGYMDLSRDIVSGVIIGETLYWSEYIYDFYEIDEGIDEESIPVSWRICAADLNSNEFSVISESTADSSEIIPVLSCDSDFVYWYAAQDGVYSVMCYNPKNKTVNAAYENVICNNPYTRYISVGESKCVLTESGFEIDDVVVTAPTSGEKCAYWSNNERYIVWVETPAADNYTEQTVYIYDIYEKNTYTIDNDETDGTLYGCCAVGEYICINCSDSENGSNFTYLIDIDSPRFYELHEVFGDSEPFSWVFVSEDGSIWFEGEKVYQLENEAAADEESTYEISEDSDILLSVKSEAGLTEQSDYSHQNVSLESTGEFIDLEMPSPFDTSCGVDEHFAFYQPCVGTRDDIPVELMNLVDSDERTAYIDSFSTLTTAPDSICGYANIYSFIKEFDISKDAAKSALAYYLESDDEQIRITEEQLDIIFSNDIEQITITFASDYSIVVGEHIYNPYWVYTHSISDYKAAGISSQDILSRVELYSALPLTDDAKNAFEKKLSEYTGTAVELLMSGCVTLELGDKSTLEISDTDDFTMTAENVSPLGVEIKVSNNSERTLYRGSWYVLEKEENNEWFEVLLPNLDDLESANIKRVWTNSLEFLESGETRSIEMQWDNSYGELPNGHYRVVKEYFFNEMKQDDTIYVACEFDVE
ncbi:MAG: hypothetical protein LIO69_06640 [Oscillospiraceae bacterium]|nr:hypothetical protein [Oscillospiraceae bacterium]